MSSSGVLGNNGAPIYTKDIVEEIHSGAIGIVISIHLGSNGNTLDIMWDRSHPIVTPQFKDGQFDPKRFTAKKNNNPKKYKIGDIFEVTTNFIDLSVIKITPGWSIEITKDCYPTYNVLAKNNQYNIQDVIKFHDLHLGIYNKILKQVQNTCTKTANVSVGWDEDFDRECQDLFDEILKDDEEPKNNDGRDRCYWCGTPTKQVAGIRFSNYNICPKCKK
jgi:hypothetical protein